jgi:hypothetical protein
LEVRRGAAAFPGSERLGVGTEHLHEPRHVDAFYGPLVRCEATARALEQHPRTVGVAPPPVGIPSPELREGLEEGLLWGALPLAPGGFPGLVRREVGAAVEGFEG